MVEHGENFSERNLIQKKFKTLERNAANQNEVFFFP
jgi:hypothetical protein